MTVTNNTMNIEELKQRAEAGDAEAMCDLGMAYFHGEGVEQDQEKAVELLQASVDAGDEYAPFLLGQMYLHGHIEDKGRLIDLFRQLIELLVVGEIADVLADDVRILHILVI